MTTREAIQLLAGKLRDELVIGTTGFTSRDLQACADRPGNFYMIGSMGLAASLGLGVALQRPEKTVVVFDGDGSVLMGLGALPAIAEWKPANLVHVVFDNEAFASTGNQPTCSRTVDLDRLAEASGYARVCRAEGVESLEAAWRKVRAASGPSFLLVKCRPNAGKPAERIRLEPEQITARFMEEMNGSS